LSSILEKEKEEKEVIEEKAFYWPKDYPISGFLIGVAIGVCLWVAFWALYPWFIKSVWSAITSFFWF